MQIMQRKRAESEEVGCKQFLCDTYIKSQTMKMERFNYVDKEKFYFSAERVWRRVHKKTYISKCNECPGRIWNIWNILKYVRILTCIVARHLGFIVQRRVFSWFGDFVSVRLPVTNTSTRKWGLCDFNDRTENSSKLGSYQSSKLKSGSHVFDRHATLNTLRGCK